MGCVVDIKFRTGLYPNTFIAIFASSTDFNDPQSDTYIANTPEGYWTEFQKCGQDNQIVPGTRKLNDISAVIPGPYSTRLRPLNNLDSIITMNSTVFLEKIQWVAYDSVNSNASSDYQDPTVVANIVNSRSANQPYAQSIYLNAINMSWQPNFFRPEVIINGKNVYQMMSGSDFGTNTNQGDLSMGLNLPRCDEFLLELDVMKSIGVYAQCGQIIDMGLGVFNIQRYPVQCEITFWLGNQGSQPR